MAPKLENTPQESFEDQMKKSGLYELNLINDAFLAKRLSKRTKDFLQEISESLRKGKSLNRFLVEQGVLTAPEFQARALSKPDSVDIPVFAFLLRAEGNMKEAFSMLVEKKVLDKGTLWSKFLHYGNFFNKAVYKDGFDWKHLLNSEILITNKIDTPTDGFDAVEIKALQADLLGQSKKSEVYPLDWKAHSLVQRMRGQENTGKMSQQIETVLGSHRTGPVMEDFGKVFEYYLKKAPLYHLLLKRDADKKRKEKRARNVKTVNDRQLKMLKKDYPSYRPHESFNPAKRHFDIYARYGHDRYGSMDPLQLAFISRAAEWYIMGGRSRLFNSVRVVPYRWAGEETIPYAALAVCKGSELLPVSGRDFSESIIGANRTFLTHSDSMEATIRHSIPVIGLATYNNPGKRSQDEKNFAVFHANFDPKDQNRYDGGRVPPSQDVNGDIVGLINEALRTMAEVEDKEIARAEEEEARQQQEMPLAA